MKHRRELSVAAALLVLMGLLAVFTPAFYGWDHFRSVLVRNAPVLVASVGMTLMIVSRQIDISIGSQVSICVIVSGLLAESGWPMAYVVASSIACGCAFGAVNGWLVAELKLPSIVVTLATMVIGRESLRFAREGEFVRNLPPGFQWFGLSQNLGCLVILGMATAIFVAFGIGLRFLSIGRAVYAVGSDPEAARLAGIRPDRVTLAVFIVMGGLAGVAAILDAVRFSDLDTNSGVGMELKVIAAVVVGGTAMNGGRGTLLGTFLGVILLGAVGPALVFFGFEPHWERALQGGIILIAVASDAFGRGGRR